jgi:hypothetical protein
MSAEIPPPPNIGFSGAFLFMGAEENNSLKNFFRFIGNH